MKVIVYVEGQSDAAALPTLLAPIIDDAHQRGVEISFLGGVHSRQRTGKSTIVIDGPGRAANILRNNPDSVVVLLPDLYPPLPDASCSELTARLEKAFRLAALTDNPAILTRFAVFCLVHDLEVLLLAAEESLLSYLQLDCSPISWRRPVEEQNHERPPKHIVERLFESVGRKYIATVDAPEILATADLELICERCPVAFSSFVDFLQKFSSRSQILQ